MSSKSRRKRGKRSFHGKKRRDKLTPVLQTAEQVTASQTGTPTASPAPSPTVTAPPAGKPAPAATPAVARYPYVTSELKRIGIIAAIMIAVLAILSRVLS
jgi:hypothetical protein